MEKKSGGGEKDDLMHACSYVYGDGHGAAVSYHWDGTVEKRELYVEGVSMPEDQWGRYVREQRPLAVH